MNRLKTIASGQLEHNSGRKVNYTVTNGWEIKASLECDRKWKAATVELLNFIVNQKYDEAELKDVLESLSLEDAHWDWCKKALAFSTNEYEWFHLYADSEPQGACVIYHPKESALSGLDIFYVEFLAVAPWNRKNKIRKREFKGVGRALLTAALRFSVDQLKLSPGFCLHSLDGAHQFYKDLQMVRIASHDKDTLVYFELPAICAEKLMGVA
jgi:hypothetical protein